MYRCKFPIFQQISGMFIAYLLAFQSKLRWFVTVNLKIFSKILDQDIWRQLAQISEHRGFSHLALYLFSVSWSPLSTYWKLLLPF